MMVQNRERVLIMPNSVQLENQSGLIMAISPQLNPLEFEGVYDPR